MLPFVLDSSSDAPAIITRTRTNTVTMMTTRTPAAAASAINDGPVPAGGVVHKHVLPPLPGTSPVVTATPRRQWPSHHERSSAGPSPPQPTHLPPPPLQLSIALPPMPPRTTTKSTISPPTSSTKATITTRSMTTPPIPSLYHMADSSRDLDTTLFEALEQVRRVACSSATHSTTTTTTATSTSAATPCSSATTTPNYVTTASASSVVGTVAHSDEGDSVLERTKGDASGTEGAAVNAAADRGGPGYLPTPVVVEAGYGASAVRGGSALRLIPIRSSPPLNRRHHRQTTTPPPAVATTLPSSVSPSLYAPALGLLYLKHGRGAFSSAARCHAAGSHGPSTTTTTATSSSSPPPAPPPKTMSAGTRAANLSSPSSSSPSSSSGSATAAASLSTSSTSSSSSSPSSKHPHHQRHHHRGHDHHQQTWCSPPHSGNVSTERGLSPDGRRKVKVLLPQYPHHGQGDTHHLPQQQHEYVGRCRQQGTQTASVMPTPRVNGTMPSWGGGRYIGQRPPVPPPPPARLETPARSPTFGCRGSSGSSRHYSQRTPRHHQHQHQRIGLSPHRNHQQHRTHYHQNNHDFHHDHRRHHDYHPHLGPQPLSPPPTVGAPHSLPPRQAPAAPTPAPAIKTRNGKGYVLKACIHCKTAHVACDVARPCQRCVRLGKQDTCVDAERKKRGRPPKRVMAGSGMNWGREGLIGNGEEMVDGEGHVRDERVVLLGSGERKRMKGLAAGAAAVGGMFGPSAAIAACGTGGGGVPAAASECGTTLASVPRATANGYAPMLV